MSLAWIAEQIRQAQAASDSYPPQLIRFNPRPPGVFREGGATEAVLDLLMEHPNRWFTYGEIINNVGRTHSAASWGLLRLRSSGKVEVAEDGNRNGRYLRYRLARDLV